MIKITEIPHDKLLHISTGLIIYSLIAIFNPLIALISVYFAGITKEIYDHLSKKGTPEIADAIYTIATPTLIYMLNMSFN